MLKSTAPGLFGATKAFVPCFVLISLSIRNLIRECYRGSIWHPAQSIPTSVCLWVRGPRRCALITYGVLSHCTSASQSSAARYLPPQPCVTLSIVTALSQSRASHKPTSQDICRETWMYDTRLTLVSVRYTVARWLTAASWSKSAWRSGETPSAGVRKSQGRRDKRTIRYIFCFHFSFLLSRCATFQHRLSSAMSAFVSRVLFSFLFSLSCISAFLSPSPRASPIPRCISLYRLRTAYTRQPCLRPARLVPHLVSLFSTELEL